MYSHAVLAAVSAFGLPGSKPDEKKDSPAGAAFVFLETLFLTHGQHHPLA